MPSTPSHDLHCVRCRPHPPLEVTHYQGNEIDICPKCGGLWCHPEAWNREKLGQFPQPSLAVAEPVVERAPDITAVGPSGLDCPNCHHILTRLDIGDGPIAEIDQCERCGGIWFDHAEMDHLEALRQWAIDKEQIFADKTTWGNWWFQLLSSMPVEFNIRPRRYPIVTVVIIVLNFLIFVFQYMTPIDLWIDLTARANQVLAGRTLWSPLTSMFLHGSWVHLLGNMYIFYILGDNVEDVLGRVRYLVFYLVCGLVAAVAFVVFNPTSDIPMIGASGAIAGIMAAYFILFRQSKLTFMFLFVQRKLPVWIWLGIWFLFNVIMSISSLGAVEESGVAWIAHVAGFIAGLAIVWPMEKGLVQGHALLRVMRMVG